MTRLLFAAFAITLAAAPVSAAEPDGLILPPGFHATVVADGLTGARHLAVRDNGDIYVSTRRAKDAPSAGIIALHLGADHKADRTEHFTDVDNGTGIRFYQGALYATSGTAVYRFAFGGDALLPGAPQTIVDGMPSSNHPIAFDGKGNLFVSLDGGGNVCVDPKAPKDAKPVGLRPCPLLENRGGVWRFDAARPGQKFPADGEHYATGIRNMGALDYSAGDGALYGVMHGRDNTDKQWPEFVSAADDAAIGDEMHRIVKGTDFGWPFAYYDGARNLQLVAPEYGGDGKKLADGYDKPVESFQPGRGAPLDLVFYNGNKFPRAWRGAFVAFHGGEGPDLASGHSGYNILFVPFERGHAGKPVVFADGFAGPDAADRNVSRAHYRPVGLAVGPDGALYVAESQKGRIWRISYGD